AKHRIVPSYDIRHLEKCCGAEGDCASNINLVEEPTQLYVAVRTILGFAQSSERRNIKCGVK
ncbi:MAG: hypothetical protein IKI41_01755, partial [Clostridia bacterium]|nr:hypothetical protein [Clostridia bacterium]